MEEINKNGGEERYLPDEVITEHILPRLPIKPLTQCKLVSKQWNSTISDPNFILNHFNKAVFSDPFTPLESLFIQCDSYFYIFSCIDDAYDCGVESCYVEIDLVDYGYVYDDKLVGSSNGLVCFSGRKGEFFYLYNPKTKQYHRFYPDDFDYWILTSKLKPQTSWGFGYVSSIDDYKVVRIIPYFNGEVAMVHVYSLRSNIWSKLECTCIEEGDLIVGRPQLVNETLYWSLCSGRIIAFDLARETFEFFPHLGTIRPFTNPLCVMGGCLSKYSSSNSQNDLILEIMKYPGRVVSVRYSFDLNLKGSEQLIGFTKTGKVFLTRKEDRDLTDGMADLVLIDRFTQRTLDTHEGEVFLVDSYVPSQSSPHPAAQLPNEPAEGTWPVYPPELESDDNIILEDI